MGRRERLPPATPNPGLFSKVVQQDRQHGPGSACLTLTTAQVHEQVVLGHLDLIDHLCDQVEGSLPIYLWGEWLIVVELLRVRHRVVVDLLQDVPQEPIGWPRVQLHGLRGALPLRASRKHREDHTRNKTP